MTNNKNIEYISYPKYIDKQKLENKLNEIYPNNYRISNCSSLSNNLEYLYNNYLNINNYSILDIGCNIGTYCFLSYYNNAKYVEGIDFNDKFISIANDTKINLNIDENNIRFINDNIFNVKFNTKYDIILYFNNVFWIHELHEFSFKMHKLLLKISRGNKYFVLGECFNETIEYFDKILIKFKYNIDYNYKNIIIYKKTF